MITLATVVSEANEAHFAASRALPTKKARSPGYFSGSWRCSILARRLFALPTMLASGSATTAARAMTGPTALVATQKLWNATDAVSHACGRMSQIWRTTVAHHPAEDSEAEKLLVTTF